MPAIEITFGETRRAASQAVAAWAHFRFRVAIGRRSIVQAMTTPNKLAASLFIGYSPVYAVEENASANSSFTLLRVKAMQHAMHKRREQDRDDPDEGESGKQGVT
jgi:hypothetical protein